MWTVCVCFVSVGLSNELVVCAAACWFSCDNRAEGGGESKLHSETLFDVSLLFWLILWVM